MTYLLLSVLLLTGCTIEVVIREPIPVKEMTLHAGEDQVNDVQKVIIVPTPKELPSVEEVLKELERREQTRAYLKEQL